MRRGTPIRAHAIQLHVDTVDLRDRADVAPGIPTPWPATPVYLHHRCEKGEIVYVGRASGMGTPEQVLQGRLARGHHIIQAHPELKPEVLAIQ